MDTLGREALQSGVGLFKYKSTIDVPALAMIDDVLGMACCGDKSVELNAIINAKMETRKLRLSDDKCFKIHICKTSTKCTQVLKVHDLNMKTVSQATYLGDVLTLFSVGYFLRTESVGGGISAPPMYFRNFFRSPP